MTDKAALGLVKTITDDMRTALLQGDTFKTATLREVLALFSNAEAQPIATMKSANDAPTAGARRGVGTTETPRKNLSFMDLQLLIKSEITDIESTALRLDTTHPYAKTLQDKIALLRRYVA